MLIAFAGCAGVGKSTASKVLVNQLGFKVHKFATPLKNMLRVIGATEEEIEGHLKEEPSSRFGGKSPRFAMQTLGDWGRDAVDLNFWVSQWINTLPEGRVVVDDLRFENEYNAINLLSGKAFLIVSDKTSIQSDHKSERGLDSCTFDGVVYNNGTVESFERQIYNCILKEIDNA